MKEKHICKQCEDVFYDYRSNHRIYCSHHCNGKNHKNLYEERDKIGYVGLHLWVGRKLGKPKKCEECGTTCSKRFHWANKSGEYKRELSDWKRLCVRCHFKMDKERGKKYENQLVS